MANIQLNTQPIHCTPYHLGLQKADMLKKLANLLELGISLHKVPPCMLLWSWWYRKLMVFFIFIQTFEKSTPPQSQIRFCYHALKIWLTVLEKQNTSLSLMWPAAIGKSHWMIRLCQFQPLSLHSVAFIEDTCCLDYFFCSRLKLHLFSLSYPSFWLFSHL